jgi:hypothetical protein
MNELPRPIALRTIVDCPEVLLRPELERLS